MGATVIAAASSALKLEICKQFGADHCVDYSKKGWEKVVKDLTASGVDVVYDPVC